MPRGRKQVEEFSSSEEESPNSSDGEDEERSPTSPDQDEERSPTSPRGSDEGEEGEEGEEDDDMEDLDLKLNNTYINVTYYDSSDEESDGFDEEEPEFEADFDDDGEEIDNSNIDDETEDKFHVLTERLEEVAYVIFSGKNSFRINFRINKGVKLVPKGTDCDFDIDDDGLPVMYDGGENYLLPYLVELCKRRSDLKPFNITTNCSKRRYKF